MADPYRNHSPNVLAPASGAFAVAPSDTRDLPYVIRALSVGTAGGVIRFVGRDGLECTTGPLPLGTYPVFARRILATGTTATGLTGWI